MLLDDSGKDLDATSTNFSASLAKIGQQPGTIPRSNTRHASARQETSYFAYRSNND